MLSKYAHGFLNTVMPPDQRQIKMKKSAQRCKHCALAVVRRSRKFSFAPPQTPFPGAQDGQTLTSWRWSLPSPTDQVWWKSMHAISSYRGNSHRPPARHRQDRLQYTGPLCLAHGWTVTVGTNRQPPTAACRRQLDRLAAVLPHSGPWTVVELWAAWPSGTCRRYLRIASAPAQCLEQWTRPSDQRQHYTTDRHISFHFHSSPTFELPLKSAATALFSN